MAISVVVHAFSTVEKCGGDWRQFPLELLVKRGKTKESNLNFLEEFPSSRTQNMM